MSKPCIFHIDVNSAFLSWEAVYRLYHLGGTVDLREEVAAVGGDMSLRHGIILAKSIPAKAYNIHTGESVAEALQKCPQLKLVPPNYNLYDQCSKAFIAILRQYSDKIEQFSVDEAFADMTGTENLWGDPVTAANLIRRRIRDELGFTVNIGIAENKLLAKMASDFQKPDRVHTLWRHEIPEKMWPLPIGDLFFVGRATEKKLRGMGIHTIGELAKTDLHLLRSTLKKQGEVIWSFANGFDISSVEVTPPPAKGYGNSTTIAFDVFDAETAKLVLLSLAETVCMRLRKAQVKIEIVSVSIRYADLSSQGHQMVLENATNLTGELYPYVCRLFDELWNGRPIRHLGIHTNRIKDQYTVRQIDLFDQTDYHKLESMEQAVDQIRYRYGRDAIKRAVFVGNRIDHMGGGISREKRSVDYHKIIVE